MTTTPAAPVEAKVVAATVTTTVAAVVLAVLNALQDNPNMLGTLPTWVQTLVLVVVPPVLVYVAGYITPHTHRPDLPPGPTTTS